jgi:L-serine dehydratase
VTEVTAILADKSVNIATMHLYRASRGGNAVMVIECDKEISQETVNEITAIDGIFKVVYLCP